MGNDRYKAFITKRTLTWATRRKKTLDDFLGFSYYIIYGFLR